ncbi:MAG TPA: sulfatase [Nocardioidaceae bacterium]|nr:sulfatase [Nocardioidaceae bacterium]
MKPGLVALLAALAMVVGLGAATSPTATVEDTRPNIVLITTDDMTDYELDYMPQTQQLLRDQGYAFTDFLSQHPMCCPARAQLFTGQYAQNNGVRHNRGRWGGNALTQPNNNVGRWLQRGGYRTAFVGKFLNGFNRFPVAGWDHFNHSLRPTIYSPYGLQFSEDPEIPGDVYTADYLGDKTVEYVNEFAGEGGPFFIWASHVAPHSMKIGRRWVGAVPATRHEQTPVPDPPFLAKSSFNEPDVRDKPKYLRAVMAKRDRSGVTTQFEQRVRSLQAVDEQVGNLVDALDAAGELDNTLILFTSDNGYLLGEHRLAGKNYPYEEALQVPMLARGPGFPVGSTAKTMTTVDVAATIADAAGVTPQRVQDGRSMLPVAQGTAGGYDDVLIQAGDADRAWTFRGVRNRRWTYTEHRISGEVEWYDRATDPFQLQNLAGTRPRKQARLAADLAALADCAGSACYGGAP